MNWIFYVKGDDGYTRYSNHVSDLPTPANIGADHPVTASTVKNWKQNQSGDVL